MVGAGKSGHQCFTYDGYRRVTDVSTPATADCASSKRTVAELGGAAPNWSTHAYNDAGLRTSETSHASAKDTTTTYAYPAVTAALPHAVTSTTRTPPSGTAATAADAYDATGNTTAPARRDRLRRRATP